MIRSFQEIAKSGIRAFSDPRLEKIIEALEELKESEDDSLEDMALNLDQFKKVAFCNLPLLVKIFSNQMVIPEFEEFCDTITALYDKQKENFDGEARKN